MVDGFGHGGVGACVRRNALFLRVESTGGPAHRERECGAIFFRCAGAPDDPKSKNRAMMRSGHKGGPCESY